MKKAHGEHNKRLCDELYASNKYPDWVVTTAFYSAIHFVDAIIFPFSHNGKEIKSLEGALQTDLSKRGRHETRANLVKRQLPQLDTSFRYLKENCQNARYINYKVDAAIVSNARLFLDEIITRCKEEEENRAKANPPKK